MSRRACWAGFLAGMIVAATAVSGSLRLDAQQMSPAVAAVPRLTCTATPPTVVVGGTATIHASAVSPAGEALQYSFTTTGGALHPNGADATLVTAGVAPGAIQVLCKVSDPQGRSAYRAVVVQVTAPALLAPGQQKSLDALKKEQKIKSLAPAPPLQGSAPATAAAPPPPPPPPVEAATPGVASSSGGALPPTGSAPANGSGQGFDEYALNDAIDAWEQGLRTGGIEYQVPSTMVATKVSPVSVVIHGFKDQHGQVLPGGVSGGSLPVSSRMQVELLAPANPGNFTIATPANQPAIQLVPNDSYAVWNWEVTPGTQTGPQTLEIRVSLVYQPNGAGSPTTDLLEDKRYPVTVNVQPISTDIHDAFWKDPLAWFQYMLPGGAGWGALAALVASLGGISGLVAWWKRRRKRRVAAQQQDEAKP